ncbi:choline/carnitine O-acyltransferase [bacterium]|nr:choline/carnitine O-acyltransferase [bacterium]
MLSQQNREISQTSANLDYRQVVRNVAQLAIEFAKVTKDKTEIWKTQILALLFEYSIPHNFLNRSATEGSARREGIERYFLDEPPTRTAFPVDLPELVLPNEVIKNPDLQLYTAAKLLWATQKEQTWINENIPKGTLNLKNENFKYETMRRTKDPEESKGVFLDMRAYRKMIGNHVERVNEGTIPTFILEEREPGGPVVINNNIVYVLPKGQSIKTYYEILRKIKQGEQVPCSAMGLELTAVSASQFQKHNKNREKNKEYMMALNKAPFIVNLDHSDDIKTDAEIGRPIGNIYSHALINFMVRKNGKGIMVSNHAGFDGAHVLQFVYEGLVNNIQNYDKNQNNTPTIDTQYTSHSWKISDQNAEQEIHKIIKQEKQANQYFRKDIPINIKKLSELAGISKDAVFQFLLLHSLHTLCNVKASQLPANFSMVEVTDTRGSKGRIAFPHIRTKDSDNVMIDYMAEAINVNNALTKFGQLHKLLINIAKLGTDPLELLIGATTMPKAYFQSIAKTLFHYSIMIAQNSQAIKHVLLPTFTTSNLGNQQPAGTAPSFNKDLAFGIGYTMQPDKVTIDVIARYYGVPLEEVGPELINLIEKLYNKLVKALENPQPEA